MGDKDLTTQVGSPRTMTPDEILAARKTLSLTQGQLAPLLGYALKDRVSELERGVRKPGAAVALLLRAYLAGYRPQDWPSGE